MKRVALTFIGQDRPGIIAEISRCLFKSGCNIEDATMTILEGEFAMILIALLPSSDIESELKKEFEFLKKRLGLYHFWKTLPVKKLLMVKHPAGAKTYVISIIGKDKTGIVYETSHVLAKFRLNITDLNSKLTGGSSRPLFTMILEVDIPNRFNIKRLSWALKRLSRRMRVDVQIRPLERLFL